MTKKYKIFVNPDVGLDLEKIFAYISQENILVAKDIVEGLRESICFLEFFPERFAIIPEEIKMS